MSPVMGKHSDVLIYIVYIMQNEFQIFGRTTLS